MAIKVELSQQVIAFVASRAPEPRRVLRAALRAMSSERGDIRALEGSLHEYHRLRAGSYRVIFAYGMSGKRRVVRCLFAERRNVVYEVFERLLEQQLLEGERE